MLEIKIEGMVRIMMGNKFIVLIWVILLFFGNSCRIAKNGSGKINMNDDLTLKIENGRNTSKEIPLLWNGFYKDCDQVLSKVREDTLVLIIDPLRKKTTCYGADSLVFDGKLNIPIATIEAGQHIDYTLLKCKQLDSISLSESDYFLSIEYHDLTVSMNCLGLNCVITK